MIQPPQIETHTTAQESGEILSRPPGTDSMRATVSASLWQVGRGIGWMLLGVVAARLLNFGYKTAVARLGAEEFGVLALALMVLGVASWVTSDGLGSSLIRYVPFYRGRGDLARLRGTILLCLGMNGLLATLGGILLFLSAPWVAERVFHHAKLAPLIRVMACVLPLFNLRAVILRVLIGMGRTDYYVYVYYLCESAVTLLLTVWLLCIGWGTWGAVVGYATGLAMSLVFAGWLLEFKTFPIMRGQDHAVFEGAELLRYAIPLWLIGYADVVHAWADVALLGYLRDARTVGLYSVGVLLASVVASIPDMVLPVSSRLVVQHYAQQKIEEATRIADAVAKWMFVLALPLAGLVLVCARPIIQLLFGQEYLPAIQVVSLLVVGKLCWTLSTSAAWMLNMVKRTRVTLRITIISTTILVVLNLWLIPSFGAVGASLATCVALILHSVITIGCARRYVQGGVFPSRGWSIALAGVAPLAVGLWMMGRELHHVSTYGLVAVAYLAAYIALLFALRVFRAEDLAMIQGLMRLEANGIPVDRRPSRI